MMLPQYNAYPEAIPGTHESDVSIIRREFITLTGNLFSAVILNQLLYWTLRVKDFDSLLSEERQVQPNCNVTPRHGWIYKTAEELNDETMLCLSSPSIRKYLKSLIDRGWVDERTNPTKRWDKTTQYRVNLRKLQEDLIAIKRSLPEVYLKAFGLSISVPVPSNDLEKPLAKSAENPSIRNFASKERNFASNENQNGSYGTDPQFSAENSNQKIFASNEKIFASKEKSFASKERIFVSNTENTTENKNKEYTHCAREVPQHSPVREEERSIGVCEVFDKKSLLEKESCSQGPSPQVTKQRPFVSVSEAMAQLWRKHVRQEVLTPTKKRSHLLESALQLYFEGDLKRWETFCARIKNVPFLMGQGPNGWHISLDWVLREGNILKVLERNFDSASLMEQQQAQLATTERELQMHTILERIKDPVWKGWCSQLAFPPPLPPGWLQTRITLFELEEIAQAGFVEFDGRVVVVETENRRSANRIQDLRFQLLPVIQATYPNARSISPQLIKPITPSEAGKQAPSHPQHFTSNKGEIHNE